ncbi:inositol phospholipid synthesis and fat-storage-inducing TM-domain-containing protein [Aspergillus aurantiobrunneus]
MSPLSSTPTPPPTTTTQSRFTPPATALLVYPATLVLGSLFSVLSPTAHQPPTPAEAQAKPINYFARKDNIFNLYFVKIGWIWFTIAFALLVIAHPPSPSRGKRQAQALARYALATAVWYATTQWFFGPAIIDRSFVVTGGKCEAVLAELHERRDEKGVLGAGADEPFGIYLTAAACKAAGGAWRGGHDVSGHVFMLVLLTAVLGFEALGVMAQGEAVNVEENGKKAEESDSGSESAVRTWTLRFVGGVFGLGWWMLLMTAIWFHTWLEKANGLLISLAALYTIYILPRRVIPWRNVVGIPGA